MKAAYTPQYGPADVLEIRNMSRPEIGPDDVLIEVRASAVTEGDRRMRASDFPGIFSYLGGFIVGFGGPRNAVQGTMFAGRVIEVGANVTEFVVGDDVFGAADSGAWAEMIAVPASTRIAKMPSNMSYEEAAAVPYGAVTALHFLRDLGNLRSGERVLILGASGGVGRWAVQIAAALGAEVTGVASAANADLVRSLGAAHVLDYDKDDFRKSGQHDVVFDIAGASSFMDSRGSLRNGGRYLTVYAAPTVMMQMLMTKFLGTRRALCGVAVTSPEHLTMLRSMIEAGQLRAHIGGSYPLDEIVEAHRHEARVRNAAIVVRPTEPAPNVRAAA